MVIHLAKDIVLSPFSFGKIASAVTIERPPPDCKTDRKQGKRLYRMRHQTKKMVSRVASAAGNRVRWVWIFGVVT